MNTPNLPVDQGTLTQLKEVLLVCVEHPILLVTALGLAFMWAVVKIVTHKRD